MARRLFLEEQQAQQDYEQRTMRGTPYQQGQYQSQAQGQQGAGAGFESTLNEITSTFKSLASTAQAKLASSGYGRGGPANNRDAAAGSQGGTRPTGELTQQLGQYAEGEDPI